jgi:hypothetical protein
LEQGVKMGIKHHGIKNLTQFAMEVIRSSGKKHSPIMVKETPILNLMKIW